MENIVFSEKKNTPPLVKPLKNRPDDRQQAPVWILLSGAVPCGIFMDPQVTKCRPFFRFFHLLWSLNETFGEIGVTASNVVIPYGARTSSVPTHTKPVVSIFPKKHCLLRTLFNPDGTRTSPYYRNPYYKYGLFASLPTRCNL